jgi:hypothetical protein
MSTFIICRILGKMCSTAIIVLSGELSSGRAANRPTDIIRHGLEWG